MCVGILSAQLQEGPDGCWRRVEDVRLVFLDYLPHAVLTGIGRGTLIHQARRPVAQGSVDDVGVSRDPADVRRAPVDVVVLYIEDPLGGGVDMGKVSARGVDYTFGFTRRP